MRRSFVVKLVFLVAMLLLVLYLALPNINIILAQVDSSYRHVTIFYTNDAHGQIMLDQGNKVIGMALVKHLIDRDMQRDPNYMLLDAGDTLYGSNETDLNGGLPFVDVMNRMGYTAMTIGNHEFDFGSEATEELSEKAGFPFLSANLYKDGKRMFQSYIIKEIAGIKIGIIGISTEDTLTRTKPEYVKGMEIRDGSEVLKELLPEVREKSDFIILLAHEHTDRLREIAREFGDIGLIIAGHDHTEFKRPEKCGNSYIVSSGLILRKLGKIDLVFKERKLVYLDGRLLSSSSKRNQDREILAVVNSYHEKISKELDVKIGKTLNDLADFNRARYMEVNFGDAIADAMRENTGAEIALQNGGGIRTNIPAGDITLYSINEAFPFVNYVVEVEMTGQEIWDALQHGVEKYPTEWNGGFLQVSGLEYCFDGSRQSGDRLVYVKTGGRDLDPGRVYRVATNDYLCQGGDGYEVIKNSRFIRNTGLLIKDVFREYVKKHKTLEVETDGRIKIMNPIQ